jgi:hypothetical protein
MDKKKGSAPPTSEESEGSPSFRADNGRFLTEALFWETNRDRTKNPPVFTLKDEEHEGLPSLKAEYLRIGDPTEYRFATEVLGSFQHWKALTRLGWFQPHLEEMRAELDGLLRAEAAQAAREILGNPGASDAARLQAAKFLSDRGWSSKPGKGRPKKGDVERAAREEATAKGHLEDDYARIMGARH